MVLGFIFRQSLRHAVDLWHLQIGGALDGAPKLRMSLLKISAHVPMQTHRRMAGHLVRLASEVVAKRERGVANAAIGCVGDEVFSLTRM